MICVYGPELMIKASNNYDRYNHTLAMQHACVDNINYATCRVIMRSSMIKLCSS